MQQKTHVLMVGCGKMGSALLTRWLDQTNFTFTIVSPSGRSLGNDVRVVRSSETLHKEKFDLIVIAVKPQMIPELLPAYTDLLTEDGCFLSIAAGFAAQSFQALVGKKSLIRIMPNLPVQIGKGVSALFANQHTSQKHRQLTNTLMASTGQQIWVDTEDDIDRLTAIVGSGPGYAFEIARCWTKAGQGLGFSESKTREMVLQTLAGSIEMALGSEASLGELRDSVTSKNGTTAAGLSALNQDAGLDRLLQNTLDAAYARAVALR